MITALSVHSWTDTEKTETKWKKKQRIIVPWRRRTDTPSLCRTTLFGPIKIHLRIHFIHLLRSALLLAENQFCLTPGIFLSVCDRIPIATYAPFRIETSSRTPFCVHCSVTEYTIINNAIWLKRHNLHKDENRILKPLDCSICLI